MATRCRYGDRVSHHPYLDGPRPLALAHRGGALLPENDGIENTLAAFENAVRLGYSYLETDVHTSRDGVVYAFHDVHLGRLTGHDADLFDLSSAEIDRLRVGSEPIPRLADLLDAFPTCRFNVDVKSDGAVEPAVRVVAAAAAAERVCLASFSGTRLRRLRRLCPDAARSASPAEIAWVRLGPLVALRRIATRAGANCVQVPERRGPVTVVTRSFVEHAHDLGLEVHVWTVDDAADMERLLDLGVDGLVTDRPDVLRDVLTARGEWRP